MVGMLCVEKRNPYDKIQFKIGSNIRFLLNPLMSTRRSLFGHSFIGADYGLNLFTREVRIVRNTKQSFIHTAWNGERSSFQAVSCSKEGKR